MLYMKLNLVVVLAHFLAGAMEVQAAAVRDETLRGKNDALGADHEDTAEDGAYEDEYQEAREEFDDIDINSDGLIDRGELQAVDNHVRWANSQHNPLALTTPAWHTSLPCSSLPQRRATPHGRTHTIVGIWSH